MNTEQIEKAKEKLSLALVAALNDLDSAKIIAETKGISFERDSVISLIRDILGEDGAKKLEQKWPAEQTLTQSTVNKVKAAIYHSKEIYSKLIDFSLFNEKAQEFFQQFAAASNMAMARSAEATSSIEIPDITYAITGEDDNTSIILRFKEDIPEILQKKDAYQVSVDDEPIQVIKISCYPTKNKVQLWLASDAGVARSCTCAIGYDPETNDSVGIFLTKNN